MGNEKTEWKDGFLFLANDLALDFLNTRPVMDGKDVEFLPDFPSLLRWFLAAGVLEKGDADGLLRSVPKARALALRDLLEFRERLRTEITNWEKSGKVSAAMMEDLNRQLAAHPMRIQLVQQGSALTLEDSFQPKVPADLLTPIAAAAARLLASADHTRVRRCDACVLHFHDTSKKGTRRWCSMDICGNRAKVAAYAARQRVK